jgi:hypothetical protein
VSCSYRARSHAERSKNHTTLAHGPAPAVVTAPPRNALTLPVKL